MMGRNILFFILSVLLIINTYFMYPLESFKGLLEPIVIWLAVIIAVVVVYIQMPMKSVISRRRLLRVSFWIFMLFLVLSVIRRVVEYLNGAFIWWPYLNTLLYLVLLFNVLYIAHAVYEIRKKNISKVNKK